MFNYIMVIGHVNT